MGASSARSAVAGGGEAPLTPGAVALVPFPFTDLSRAKLRPAVILAGAGRGDWVLCQITSNVYADPDAVELTDASFARGSLQRTSYTRPGKLFTASSGLITGTAGTLNARALRGVVSAVITLLERGLSPTR